MDFSKPYYLFDNESPNGLLRIEPVIRRVVNSDDALRACQTDIAIRIPAAFDVNNNLGLKPVGLSVKKEYTIACCRITKVKLDTYFVLVPTEGPVPAFFTPCFAQSPEAMGLPRQESVRLNLSWQIPNDMVMFFAAKMNFNGSGWKPSIPLFFGRAVNPRNQEEQGFFRLPLPNQYGDGKMCLGDAERHIADPSLQGAFQKELDLFCNSTWNTDAAPIIANTRAVFQFNASDMTQRNGVGPNWWLRNCTKGNHIHYAEAAL